MPHYLGGKLGRSSSRSIFPSIHFTPRALSCFAAPALLLSSFSLSRSSLRLREWKKERALHPFYRSFALSRILSVTFGLSICIVNLRIGSLSTRDSPLSPFSYRPIVVSPAPLLRILSLTVSPAGHTTSTATTTTTATIITITTIPPILHCLRTERACDNLLGRSSEPRIVRDVLALWALSFPIPENRAFSPTIGPRVSSLFPPHSNPLPPFLLVLIPYSCVIYAGSG